jgi:twitching motility protein PilT
MNQEMQKIIDLAINQNASDIHLQTGEKPVLRVAGRLLQVEDTQPFQLAEGTAEFKEFLNEFQLQDYVKNGNTDFAFGYGEDYRLRGNVFRRLNGLSVSFRLIRNRILSFEQLGLPSFFRNIAEQSRQGFYLITGPTGQGKTTSLAALLDHINRNFEAHIITIEDPIEYVLKNKKSIVEQREIGTHASSFSSALRSAMRQDPDVIMIGEMRDFETIQAALTLAETGHLVFSTLHTNDSVQTVDRIIDSFPEDRQKQIRIQLASTLSGVISQRLVPGKNNDLVFAYEVLMVNDAIRNIIRSENIEQIYNSMQSGENVKEGEESALRLEQCLARLVKQEKISREIARAFAANRELLDAFMNY